MYTIHVLFERFLDGREETLVPVTGHRVRNIALDRVRFGCASAWFFKRPTSENVLRVGD